MAFDYNSPFSHFSYLNFKEKYFLKKIQTHFYDDNCYVLTFLIYRHNNKDLNFLMIPSIT